ncbi:MAG: cephalosporin hydroxylase [Moorea sp. SIO3I7]|nr:cephalosporin hydroxylase [Moorena sp. SIO3I7]
MVYQRAIRESRHKLEPLKTDRFVKISEREDRCDLPESAWSIILQDSYLQTHKGVILAKGIMQVSLYPMLLFELKPKTIIELGAFNGGSAIWLADNLELFGIKGSVYSVDIDISLLDDTAKADSRIHFLEGDCNRISAVLPQEQLSQLPHPWLIIEDAHVNLIGVLDHFHQNGLQIGDYLIVEDTNKILDSKDIWKSLGDLEESDLLAGRKMDDLRKWLVTHQDEYLVDTYYLDRYGYNVSKNWNSILKRV